MWEHEATQRLYLFLWLVMLASVLLPAAQLFTLTGVYLGLKFFLLEYVFFRYPRIRLKYDSTSRLWDTLPTDSDLERRGEKVYLFCFHTVDVCHYPNDKNLSAVGKDC